jgi:hypothetical protein
LAWAAAGCSPGRVVESVEVLTDIQAIEGPSLLKDSTPTPRRVPIEFEIAGRTWAADLYSPGDGEAARAGVVVVPGVTPRGRNDKRVVAFANTLARARFEVLVPDLVHMRALQVTGLDAIPIADSAAYLDERGDGWPVGIAAVSFAVGPGVKALLEPEARNRVDFLLGIGGYYDLDALITYITTGYFRADAGSPWSYRQPSDYGKWVFLLSNAARIEDEADQKILFEIANRKLADPGADVEDMVQGLGPEGLAVYALLTNGDPDRVPSLIGALPSDIRFEMQFLDMDRFDLSGLDVDFILIHGSYDPVIPASESVALARAVDPGRARVYLIDSLDHAHPQPPSLGDGLRMLRAVYAILVQRDG